jgi:hypothetical protein
MKLEKTAIQRQFALHSYTVKLFIILSLCNMLVFATTSFGATYYVRSDGAQNGICDGTMDVAAPGSDGHCSWSHPYEAFPPGGTARIAGGDTLIIKSGSYKMGHTSGIYDTGDCSSGWPWSCFMAPIPSGPDKDHVTKIYGEGWDQGCMNPPELWGAEAAGRIINLEGTSNVEVQCLDITDHAECANNHGGAIAPSDYKCTKGAVPTGDWASSGLYIKDGENGLVKNVKVHGLSSFGIKTGALTDWTFDHVKLVGNGYGGFSNDIYGSKNVENSCHGDMTFVDGTISWNGCVEKYPDDGQPFQCYDQNQGGYGDAFGSDYTVGTWTFERMNISFNSSDGIDLLYHRFDLFPSEPEGVTIVRDSYFKGNVGNSIKTRGNAIVTNNMLIGNCDYLNPETSPYTIAPRSDGTKLMTCRGNATTTHSIHNDADLIVANNSYTGQSDIMLNIGGKEMQTGGETAIIVNNIFQGGPHFQTESKLVDGIYAEWQVLPTFHVNASNNIYYNSKGEPSICDTESTSSSCEEDPIYSQIDFATGEMNFHLPTNTNLSSITTSPAYKIGLLAGSYIGTVSGISVNVPDTDIDRDLREGNVTPGADEPSLSPSIISIIQTN